MSFFDKIFMGSPLQDIWGKEAPPSSPLVGPTATEMELAKQQQDTLQSQYNRMIQGSMLQMGMGQASAQAYKPPPPPKVKHVGGDHPYQMFLERGGTWPSILYKDILIPHERYQQICSHITQEEWDGMGLEEKKEYIYLEARKLLITEG